MGVIFFLVSFISFAQANPPFPDSDLSADFSGIIALDNCSAALVRLTGSLGRDRGLLLTNGHCLGDPVYLRPGEYRSNVPASRLGSLLSSAGSETLGTVRTDRLLYATMTQTDLALYRLTESFDAIERRLGVRPLTLSNRKPSAGQRVQILSGYLRRAYVCSIAALVNRLREGAWSFSDSIRFSRPGCETVPGTSGAPILDVVTREVVGVNNTGNASSSGRPCGLNHPCEVGGDGRVRSIRGARYGQQTFWVYSCLKASQAELDLSRVGCQLPH